MATTVSAWGTKPGSWATDSEEHEEELKQSYQPPQSQPLSDFPSLSAAVVTKTKKKKPQSVSLSEFTTGKSVSYGSAKSAAATQPRGLTPDELLALPTGPRERSAEELERSSRGGFRSYGDSNGGGRGRDDDSSRWGGSRDRDDSTRRALREPLPPSKADEVDDWGAAKKSNLRGPSSFDRRDRDRGSSGGGFFDSQQSRADESDSWSSKKSFVPSSRTGGGGFDRERRSVGFDREVSNGGGADSDNWGKKRGGEEGVSENGRPRLVLQPRSLPVSNGDQQQQQPGSASATPKGNPFGAARPREEVLAEKGQDWKKIDEQLESAKIKEISSAGNDGSAFGKKSLANGNGRMRSPEERTQRSWRTSRSVDSPTPSEDKADNDGETAVAEN